MPDFVQESDIIEHFLRSFDLGMAEGGTVLKVAEFFQEFRNLDNDVEHIFRCGVVSLVK